MLLVLLMSAHICFSAQIRSENHLLFIEYLNAEDMEICKLILAFFGNLKFIILISRVERKTIVTQTYF